MTAHHTKQTHNFIAFGIDVIFFGLALKFIDPTTILPAFATQLGASSTLLGLLITTFHLAWSLPQLAAGNVVARYPSKKPALLIFGILILLIGGQSGWLSLLLLFGTLIVMFGTDAFAALAWFDMLGRSFPPEKRGGYLSIWESG